MENVRVKKKEKLKNVIIYTDGACSGNPGPGGWAAILYHAGKQKEIAGGEPHTTNNRMELRAAIEALKALKTKCVVDIYTDSGYVKDGITKWLFNWQKNNWKTANKDDVKNVELWQELVELNSQHKVYWHWVKGHAGCKENERVDLLAKAQIKAQK